MTVVLALPRLQLAIGLASLGFLLMTLSGNGGIDEELVWMDEPVALVVLPSATEEYTYSSNCRS